MSKKYLVLILMSLVLSKSVIAEMSYSQREFSTLMSASILLSPILIPMSVIEGIKASSFGNPNYQNNLKVKKVASVNEKETLVNVDIAINDRVENFDLTFPKNAVAELKVNDDILLKKNEIGFALSFNDRIIGISPNEESKNYFLQEKIS